MKSYTSERFWKYYANLPQGVRQQARQAYALFEKNPYYPSLHFKRIHSTRTIFSVRISMDYRAVGIVAADEITWFWIGSHSEYNILLRKLRNT
ncbi:MAG: hypothetical protein NTX50_18180 [Candidatus Sumerlaeota bacterium]|nr:hypothetical protein [Candidatus Sumerlaeota bacterium]